MVAAIVCCQRGLNVAGLWFGSLGRLVAFTGKVTGNYQAQPGKGASLPEINHGNG
jgi:hypothetical protein